ncbi:hypothetical protein CK228_20180 [Mesorhizobium sp. WSM4312]|nr:hypothetical protein CK228_20180 [Mesorhizobium sp. WSM4312]
MALAIGDCLEGSHRLSVEQVRLADEQLQRNGLPTISYLRARHRSGVEGILKRNKIRNEREYYAVRNVVEVASDENGRTELWRLLSEFENI